METTFSRPAPTTIAYERALGADADTCWRAYTDAAVVRRWLGRGEFVECEMDMRPGGAYRWVWQLPDFRLQIHGDVLEATAPSRLVTREWMSDMDAPPTVNVVGFVPGTHGTCSMRGTIECETAELADAMWATGMADGMEESFARLDEIVRG